MDRAKGILLVLSAVLFTAECFYPFEKRQEDPLSSSECNAGFVKCIAEIQISVLANVQDDLQGTVDNFGQVCVEYQRLAECLRPYLDECGAVDVTHIQTILSIGNFFCSEHGQSLVAQFKNTVCYENPERLFEPWDSFGACLQNAYSSDPENLGNCQQAAAQATCFQQAAIEECGEVAGHIAEGYINSVWPVAHAECYGDSSSDLLKRALFG
ncbi:hypothetical protein BsWGS_23408 [Bradybaena similaris]